MLAGMYCKNATRVLFPEKTRGLSRQRPEIPDEMGLIGISGIICYVGEVFTRIIVFQQAHRLLKTDEPDELLRGKAKHLHEMPLQCPPAHPQKIGDFLHLYLTAAVVDDRRCPAV